jgi:hypothetical protein
MIKFFLAILITASISWATNNKKVYLEVELEDVVGASEYEVEYKLQSESTSVQSAKSKRQSETIFKLLVEAGNYSVRTRSIADTNQSDWSDWFVLTALPDTPSINQPEQTQLFTSKKNKSAEIPLSWKKTNGAESYQLIIQNLDSNKIQTLITQKNKLGLKLPKGRFRVGLQSISNNSIKSEVVYYPDPFLVTEKKLDRIDSSVVDDQMIKWKNTSAKNINIDVYIKRFFSNEYVLLKNYSVQTEPWTIPKDLKPGEYEFRLQALSDEFENSEIEIHRLLIKPQEKDFKPQF